MQDKSAEGRPLILVVDDDRDTRLLYTTYLNVQGFNVDEAPNAHAALHRIEAQPPRVVLTDLMLPGISGFELCETIRSSDPNHEIAIVALSGRPVTEDERQRGGGACFDRVLLKPCQLDDLFGAICDVLRDPPSSLPPRACL
jgi:two-component system, sensor histidine kinase ChiS